MLIGDPRDKFDCIAGKNYEKAQSESQSAKFEAKRRGHDPNPYQTLD